MDTDPYSKNTTTCMGVTSSGFLMVELGWGESTGSFNVLGWFVFLRKSEINMKICLALMNRERGPAGDISDM